MLAALPVLPSGSGLGTLLGEGVSSLALVPAGAGSGAWSALLLGECALLADEGSTVFEVEPSSDGEAPLSVSAGVFSSRFWSAACALPSVGSALFVGADGDYNVRLLRLEPDSSDSPNRLKALRTICTAHARVTALAAVAVPDGAGGESVLV